VIFDYHLQRITLGIAPTYGYQFDGDRIRDLPTDSAMAAVDSVNYHYR
jgi:hypothetical protein